MILYVHANTLSPEYWNVVSDAYISVYKLLALWLRIGNMKLIMLTKKRNLVRILFKTAYYNVQSILQFIMNNIFLIDDERLMVFLN